MNRDEVSAVTLDEDADTPDSRVVTRDPVVRRTLARKKVIVRQRSPDRYDVIVHDEDDEGIFEEHNLTRREAQMYLRGVDAGVFPDALELPEGWKA